MSIAETPDGQRRPLRGRVARCVRKWGRNLLVAGVALLAVAAVLRALVGLLEAATLLVLALVLASLTLPRGLTWHWRRLRREIPGWLQTAAGYFEGSGPVPPADRPPKTEKN